MTSTPGGDDIPVRAGVLTGTSFAGAVLGDVVYSIAAAPTETWPAPEQKSSSSAS